MAGRKRDIKPEWLDSELALASPEARVLSVSLILLADDQGNGHAHPSLLASRVFPGQPREASRMFESASRELSRLHYVVFYEVDGQQFFHICNWKKHQKIDHPSAGKVPGPPVNNEETHEVTDTRESSRALDESSRMFDEPSTNPRASRDARAPSLSDPPSGSLFADPDPDLPDRSGSRRRSKATRTVKRQLPDDWSPSEAHRAEAKKLGVSCDGEALKFRDYCQANARGYADFEAAFRNWLRRSKDFGPRKDQRGRTATDIAFGRVRELQDLELSERDKRDLDSVFGGVGT